MASLLALSAFYSFQLHITPFLLRSCATFQSHLSNYPLLPSVPFSVFHILSPISQFIHSCFSASGLLGTLSPCCWNLFLFNFKELAHTIELILVRCIPKQNNISLFSKPVCHIIFPSSNICESSLLTSVAVGEERSPHQPPVQQQQHRGSAGTTAVTGGSVGRKGGFLEGVEE